MSRRHPPVRASSAARAAATAAGVGGPEKRSTATVCAGTVMIRTAGSFGSGRLSRVALAGMKKRMRQAPASSHACATGAVIAMRSGRGGRSGACATGAAITIRARPRLAPKM